MSDSPAQPPYRFHFLCLQELLVQFALLLRSVSVHRGNEPCQLCVAGDDTHPYGKVSASELND